MLREHGVRNAMQSSEIRAKAKQTHFDRHGTYLFGWGKEAIQKRELALIKHFGVKHQS